MNAIEQSQSGPLVEPPLIGPSEQRLFAIEDTRERADHLQEQLVPKLKLLLDEACDLLREVYGTDVLTPYRMPTTPNHRPEAKNTKPFEEATAGLAVEGQLWFFQQRFECTSDCIRVSVFGLRGQEGNPLVQVMKRHSAEVVRLLEHDEYEILSEAIEPADATEELDFTEFISKLQLAGEREWKGTYIDGPTIDLPIEDVDAAWPVIYDFVALFPIFRAATHVLRGEDDRFPFYAEQFWKWHDQLSDDDSEEDSDDDHCSLAEEVPSTIKLVEGATKSILVNAYERNPEARRLCKEHHGTSCCICGFDFGATYGAEAEGYIHAHHLRPLSEIGAEYVVDPVKDLRPVCPNCHAVLHLGGRCRTIDEVKRLLEQQRSA